MVIRAGVIGQPVSQSLSPRIHSRWFADLGIEGRYEAVDVDAAAFETTVRRLADGGWAGVNVTMPHKEAALALADEQSAAARAIGAANLLRFEAGRIIADNTDWTGFRAALDDAGLASVPRRAVVLGAGGAAAAVLHALKDAGEVTLLNRTPAKAEALAARFANVRALDWEARQAAIGAGLDLLANTTSLGMEGQPDLDLVFAQAAPRLVVDIVYKPPRTTLLARADRAGAVVQNGLPMLVHQAVPSFEAFTGVRPDPKPVLADLLAEFA